MTVAPVAPLLVLGWGNRSRGDDALGPLCVAHLRALPWVTGRVDFLEDYQLQIEHALDLVGRQRVLLVDASASGGAPFELIAVQAAQDASLATHALSAPALLQVFLNFQGAEPPPCTLLAIRGQRFELGASPSPAALANLEAALQWAQGWLVG